MPQDSFAKVPWVKTIPSVPALRQLDLSYSPLFEVKERVKKQCQQWCVLAVVN